MDKISIVVPAFNEERAVREVLTDLRAVMKESGIPYELIVVDDGSTDETASRVREMDEVALVSHPETRWPSCRGCWRLAWIATWWWAFGGAGCRAGNPFAASDDGF